MENKKSLLNILNTHYNCIDFTRVNITQYDLDEKCEKTGRSVLGEIFLCNGINCKFSEHQMDYIIGCTDLKQLDDKNHSLLSLAFLQQHIERSNLTDEHWFSLINNSDFILDDVNGNVFDYYIFYEHDKYLSDEVNILFLNKVFDIKNRNMFFVKNCCQTLCDNKNMLTVIWQYLNNENKNQLLNFLNDCSLNGFINCEDLIVLLEKDKLGSIDLGNKIKNKNIEKICKL